MHTQIYTSKIVSIILDEQTQRCSGSSGSNFSNMHGDGSSGTKSKKCVVAASCVQQLIKDKHHMTDTCSIMYTIAILKITSFSHVFQHKRLNKPRLRWNRSPLSKASGNPKSGSSPAGATGAGRGAHSNGQKSRSEAMAASSSSTGARAGGSDGSERPRLFAEGDSRAAGAKYVRLTGSIIEILQEDEKHGRINLYHPDLGTRSIKGLIPLSKDGPNSEFQS